MGDAFMSGECQHADTYILSMDTIPARMAEHCNTCGKERFWTDDQAAPRWPAASRGATLPESGNDTQPTPTGQ